MIQSIESIVSTMVDYSERLRSAMDDAGAKTANLAAAMEVSYQAVARVLAGKSRAFSADNNSRAARFLDVNPDWLATGEGDPRTGRQPERAGDEGRKVGSDELPVVDINQFDTGGSMGSAGVVLQDQPGVIRRWSVSPEWVQQNVHRITSPKNLAIVTGFGDSMRPLYNPGDPLLLDRGIVRVDVDGVYFFRIESEGFVKRLQRIPTADGLILRAKSENPRYDPFDIVSGMDFQLFGRIVKAWCSEDF